MNNDCKKKKKKKSDYITNMVYWRNHHTWKYGYLMMRIDTGRQLLPFIRLFHLNTFQIIIIPCGSLRKETCLHFPTVYRAYDTKYTNVAFSQNATISSALALDYWLCDHASQAQLCREGMKREKGKGGGVGRKMEKNGLKLMTPSLYFSSYCNHAILNMYFRNCLWWHLKMKLSSGHAIALWKKQCGIDQKKVDHLAYKNLCVLQGSGIIKMIRNLAKSW